MDAILVGVRVVGRAFLPTDLLFSTFGRQECLPD
jgi:hypothetical protein